MIVREDDGVWVELEETISAHHDATFDSLTTPEGLVRWFCLAAEVELRQGGLITFGWDETLDHGTTVAILDYDAGGIIVWDWYADSGDRHAPIYWTVTPKTDKGSIVKFRQGPFRSDVNSLLVMAEEAQTWRWHMCNLRTTLEVKHDMRAVRPL